MGRPLIIGIIIAAALMFAGATSAFAYDELVYEDLDAESGLDHLEPGRDCIDCHGIVDPEDPEQKTRSGPHGGYSSSTTKCGACHSVHAAPAYFMLLPGPTIKSVCESCHDGTGGNGVYGVIKARTGEEPLSAHRIETTNIIPGGDPETGGPRAQPFSGPGGTLTCTDCHSPHGIEGRMVEPFLGDRYRSDRYISSDSSEVATEYATASSRLLRRAPTGADTSVTVYGTGWCATCHQGRANGSGTHNHPVQQDDHFYYNRLPVLTSLDSTETALGPLGQSNLGYRMPEITVNGETTRTPLQQESPGPLCQQCHEDVRDATQEFKITEPDGRPDDDDPEGPSTDNPRFQVFPHESNAQRLLIVPPGTSAAYTDALCLNCHHWEE